MSGAYGGWIRQESMPSGQFGQSLMGRQPQPQKSPRILSQLKQQNQVPDSYYESPEFHASMSRAGRLMGVDGGQFGQMQMGQVSGPSLEEVLSQRGFKVPEMQTGVQDQMMRMFKDPITGKMTSGGAHAATHANAMSKFYEQNPEALNIAKQYQQDQQYNPGGVGGLHQGPLRPPQEIMSPPRRPGGMENLSGSLGGQIRPSPYSAPQMPQMGGGFGGGQGMQQFMQFMQTMMQMFQQFQGGGGRGMGGGFGGPSPFRPQQQQYGQYQPRRMSNQFNSNNAFGGY